MIVEVDGDSTQEVAPQIPRAHTLPPGTRIAVRAKAQGWMSRMIHGAVDARAAHGSALLARGYVNITGGEEDGKPVTFATAPSEAR